MRGRVGEVVVKNRDFAGTSLFGGREPLPQKRNGSTVVGADTGGREGGGGARILASYLGMDPRMLHIADVDLDGYPDVAAVGRDGDGQARLIFFINSPTSSDTHQAPHACSHLVWTAWRPA